MNNKIVKAVMALVFLFFAVVLALFMIQDLQDGLATPGQKGFFALYIALFLYALWRVFVLVRDIVRK